MRTQQIVGLSVFTALWIVWCLPFAIKRRGGGTQAQVKARAARWGILLQGAAFFLAFLHDPRWATFTDLRIAASLAFEVAGCILGYSSVATLGRQWRFEAALNPDHELVQSGPYSIVRHPIYTSMFFMFVAAALMLASWMTAAAGLVLFIAGTEIRVRTEERLLSERFGAGFQAYRKRVAAYIPWLW